MEYDETWESSIQGLGEAELARRENRQRDDLLAELDRLAAENARLREALRATIEHCDYCDGDGIVETYPSGQSASAYDGAGNVIVNHESCKRCSLAREALEKKERNETANYNRG